jgi:hypothetical protein
MFSLFLRVWSENKIIIHSPKTAHQGKPTRIIPLFPELKPLLEQAFDAAPEGSVNVIKHCKGTKNYRKGLKEIILKAGLLPWPKLFNNLRSTRETELAKTYSLQAATAWIGNTPKIALGHYLQVTEQEWQNATTTTNSDAKCDAFHPYLTQNVTKQDTEPACNSSQGLTQVDDIRDVMRNDASCNEVIQSKEVTSLGSVMSLIIGEKELDSKILRPESGTLRSEAIAGNELEKLVKSLTPSKLKALKALLNMDG